MAFYTITNSTFAPGSSQSTQQNLSGTYKSIIPMFGSSVSNATLGVGPRRQRWNDFLVGTNTSPADNYIEFDVIRASILSSNLTATTNTISSFSSYCMDDPGDQGFTPYAQVNCSGEGGITALSEGWYIGINQRASYRWIANPGQELVMPANLQTTTGFPGNGFDLRARSGAYTGTVTVTVKGNEL